MSIAGQRTPSARIRILSCEPEPAPRTSSRWPIIGVSAAVGGIGVVATLALTNPSEPAPAQPVAAVVPMSVPSLEGSVNAGAFRPTRDLQRRMRQAVSADLPAAARLEPRPVAQVTRPTSVTIASATTTAVPVQSSPVVTPQAPPVTSAPRHDTSPATEPGRTTVVPDSPSSNRVGPEMPDFAAD